MSALRGISVARHAQPAPQRSVQESAFVFECRGDRLPAILHAPAAPRARGVLLVVGGPQTRVGSHRQFLLLARALAADGTPAMRFDYRGMGDAEGDARDFQAIGEDIGAAVAAFRAAAPGVEEVVLWGLCDAATAACFYAAGDPRVTGLVLLNPWVRSVQGEARAYLRHYYLQRLLSHEFWSKVLRGGFDVRTSLRGIAGTLRRARSSGAQQSADGEAAVVRYPVARGDAGDTGRPPAPHRQDLAERIARGMQHYQGRVLLILSGRDLTAREFDDALTANRRLRAQFERDGFARADLPQADHTFSRAEWRSEVERITAHWLRSW